MKKIIHIITGLGSGGAENMLYKLLKHSDKNLYYHEVISLMDEGVMGEKLKVEGIKIHSLNLNGKNLFQSIIKAKRITKNFDIVNTWLYHADIFGFLIAKIVSNKKLIWNIRHCNLDKDANESRTLKIVKLNSFLSRYVNCITYNSFKAFDNHTEVGYANKNSIVIPNGFELDKFKFDLEDRIRVRKELEVIEEEKVIITVGRWDIQKDYYTLLKALNELKKKEVNFKMIMVGTNLGYSNKELTALIDQYGLNKNLILLGRRTDIPTLLSVADIYVSSSLGESFSNAIGEAMACELPCVVTDVGDSSFIVGDTGIAVSKESPLELSKAILTLSNNKDLRILGKQARKRVDSEFSISSVSQKYEVLYLSI